MTIEERITRLESAVSQIQKEHRGESDTCIMHRIAVVTHNFQAWQDWANAMFWDKSNVRGGWVIVAGVEFRGVWSELCALGNEYHGYIRNLASSDAVVEAVKARIRT